MWSKVLYSTDQQKIDNIEHDRKNYNECFTDPIAEGLFNDIQQLNIQNKYSVTQIKEFRNLATSEKSFWYNYALKIPDKLCSLKLFIRPFEHFCRTCIITDKEITSLCQMDHDYYVDKLTPNGFTVTDNSISDDLPVNRSDRSIINDLNLLYIELNYLIPRQLRKIGYEIIRYEEIAEIDMLLVRKIARAIHSMYLHEIRSQSSGIKNYIFYTTGNAGNLFTSDFDDLPEEIKYSNIDNAVHIPTKLLSIGYKIRQTRKGFKPVALQLNDKEIETMAKVEHIRWSWEKRLNGWIFGSIKDNINKTHPCLVPYDGLSESEKEKDRELVRLIPALLQDINYEAYPISPNRISKLSYALKPQSSVHKILFETRQLNDQIRSMVKLTPEVEEMVRLRNKMIEEAITEVEESYNYAQHIQEAILPDDLYIRECFPDSFILFKPKDLVSGDFYFFSKHNDLIIFAVADCTGHGIPGALLSTVGYGILDQAVNEIKLTDPSLILHHLYSKIHKFLRNDSDETGISDDLDIILSVLDIKTNVMTFSSVKNPLYQITDNQLVIYNADNTLEECIKEKDCLFSSKTIRMHTGDTIYLCTDGYTDQFGGLNHKRYLTGRFKNLLQSIQEYSLSEQSDRLYEEIEQWREEKNEDQTDDILVVGIRI